MIKAIICRGIGFNLGTISYIPTHGFSVGIVSVVLESLKSLVLDLGGGLGQTLMPTGNVLPINIGTGIPTATPQGDKGVYFRVSGGVLTIYAWDGTQWVANI